MTARRSLRQARPDKATGKEGRSCCAVVMAAVTDAPFSICGHEMTTMRTELGSLATVPTSTSLTASALNALFVRLAGVCGLFDARCPSHVSGLVVTVVVAAVKREFWRWSSAYVRDEVRKTATPSFAHLNPAPAVILERLVLRVMATLNHRLINTVFLRRTQAMRALLRLAAARLRQPDSEIADKDVALNAAGTSTAKETQSVAARCFTENSPVPHHRAHRNWAFQRVAVLRRHDHNSLTLNGDFAWT